MLPLPSPPAQPSASSAGRPLSVSNAASASCCSLEGEGEGVEAPPGPSSERHVLIVASDGLWEWISNTTAVAIASGAACGAPLLRCRCCRRSLRGGLGCSALLSDTLSCRTCPASCTLLSPPSAAEDAAHMLVEAAQKQWAVRYRGRNCDDITGGLCVF